MTASRYPDATGQGTTIQTRVGQPTGATRWPGTPWLLRDVFLVFPGFRGTCVLAVVLSITPTAALVFAQDTADTAQVIDDVTIEEDTDAEPVAPTDNTTPTPLGDLGDLPWNKREPKTSNMPSLGAVNPRDFMANMEDSKVDSFFDDNPPDPDAEALVKILYNLPRIGVENIEPLVRDVSLTTIRDEPKPYRIQFLRLRGRVKRITAHEIVPELVEIFDFEEFYILDVDVNGSPLVIYARQLPEAWRLEEAVDYETGCLAMFLHRATPQDDQTHLVFATDRAAWYPTQPQPELGITEDLVRLASLGMDVGLIDDVKKLNRQWLGSRDRECFYQMIAAANSADPAQLRNAATAKFDIAPLLTEPQQQHGRLIRFTGNARRITRIAVNDPDIRQRFGIDHYYEIGMFVPLGDQPVRIGKGTREDEGVVFTERFPVMCCVTSLPPDLPPQDDMNQEIEITGFYFKLAAYKSEFISQHEQRQRQPSPMFIGIQPRVVIRDYSTNPIWGLVIGIGFLAVLGIAWFGIWNYNRRDEAFERETMARQLAPKSLDQLDAPDNKPDFSDLP